VGQIQALWVHESVLAKEMGPNQVRTLKSI